MNERGCGHMRHVCCELAETAEARLEALTKVVEDMIATLEDCGFKHVDEGGEG